MFIIKLLVGFIYSGVRFVYIDELLAGSGIPIFRLRVSRNWEIISITIYQLVLHRERSGQKYCSLSFGIRAARLLTVQWLFEAGFQSDLFSLANLLELFPALYSVVVGLF